MKKYIAIVVAVLCVFALIDYVGAVQGRPDKTKPIKCYQCNSFYDKGCSDFFDNRTYPLIPCPSNATMCRKIIQETYYDDHWDVRYIRQCGVFGDVGPREGRWCFERRSTFGVRLKICHCDNKDGCNVASSIIRDNSVLTFFLILSTGWLMFCGKTQRIFGHG
jgi:hypothetical protein